MDVNLFTGFVWFGAFLFSTTVHEAMHALVAWKGGDPTAYLGGQVSLSPVPHIKREPIGMLVVPLLTSLTQGWAMGWASAPYDPHWASRHPQRAALMAAAGPAGNLLIAVVALAALRIGLMAGWFIAPDHVKFDAIVGAASPEAGFAAVLLSVLLVLNVFIGLFNLLPLPPLDGSAIITVFLPDEYAERFRMLQSNPMMSMIGLMIAWKVFPLLTGSLFSMLLLLVHPHESYS
jgi:Zn-dependent protease